LLLSLARELVVLIDLSSRPIAITQWFVISLSLSLSLSRCLIEVVTSNHPTTNTTAQSLPLQMAIALGDHVYAIPINTNLSEEEHRLLEVSLSICKKDPNQWSIEEWIEASAGALIHRYLINDGSIHPALNTLLQNRGAIQGSLDQTIEADQIHQSVKTLLAVQMLLSLVDGVTLFGLDLTKHREYFTGMIVDHNINE